MLFVPIACGLSYLYLWAQPDVVADRRGPAAQADLSQRAVLLGAGRRSFSSSGSALAFLLNCWSRRQDETGDPRCARLAVDLSGPGLVVYGITITFASVDWIMSLQPAFHSTIFGPLVASGQILSAHAFALLVLAWLAPRPPLAERRLAGGAERPGQPAVHVPHHLGVHGLVPVHADLDRQSAVRRDLVSAARRAAAGSGWPGRCSCFISSFRSSCC